MRPKKKLPSVQDYLMLSDLIAYWKEKGATDEDEQDLFDRLNDICYETDSHFSNGAFILNMDEDASEGTFERFLLDEFPEECNDLDNPYIEFWVDTE